MRGVNVGAMVIPMWEVRMLASRVVEAYRAGLGDDAAEDAPLFS